MISSRNIFHSESEHRNWMKVQRCRLVLDAFFTAFGLILSGLLIGLALAVALVE